LHASSAVIPALMQSQSSQWMSAQRTDRNTASVNACCGKVSYSCHWYLAKLLWVMSILWLSSSCGGDRKMCKRVASSDSVMGVFLHIATPDRCASAD
jgi:hypothetical protein